MAGYYDYRLVALSVLIAICAAYAALDPDVSRPRLAEFGWLSLPGAL